MADLFRRDIERICERIHTRVGASPAPDPYPKAVIALLGDIMAAELTCAARYQEEYELAREIHGEADARGFLEYATEERRHAEMVARRIAALGAEPPRGDTLSRSVARAARGERSGASLEDLVAGDVAAERMITEAYRASLAWVDGHDDETAALLAEIIEAEESHVLA